MAPLVVSLSAFTLCATFPPILLVLSGFSFYYWARRIHAILKLPDEQLTSILRQDLEVVELARDGVGIGLTKTI